MSRGQVTPVEQPKSVFGQVSEAVLRDLRANGREDTALGQSALVLAGALDGATGSALAALSRELRATLDELQLAATPHKRTPLDELRERHAEREAAYRVNGSRRAE